MYLPTFVPLVYIHLPIRGLETVITKFPIKVPQIKVKILFLSKKFRQHSTGRGKNSVRQVRKIHSFMQKYIFEKEEYFRCETTPRVSFNRVISKLHVV